MPNSKDNCNGKIYSMTGFARLMANSCLGQLVCEIRSVNGKYQDFIFKISDELRYLEIELKDIARSSINRGRVEVTIQFQCEFGSQSCRSASIGVPTEKQLLEIKPEVMKSVAETIAEVSKYVEISRPSVTEVMKLHNFLVMNDKGCQKDEGELKSEIISIFDQLLASFLENRAREGEKIFQILKEKIEKISESVKGIDKIFSNVESVRRKKILEKIEDLKINVNPDRFEQELLFFLQKIDIKEEIDRLFVHIDSLISVLNFGGIIGKKVDFILQECNREINTISSKSGDVDISKYVVEVKVLLEQMREQIQNIE